jgi:hypothetical protein
MSNLYRAQFAYPPSRGLKDETFHYSFDGSNVAILGTGILAGKQVNDIYLQLQNDYEFACRGAKVQFSTGFSNLYLWLKDPFGNYLSQTYVPLSLYLTGAGGAVTGSLVIPFEPEIQCPAGGVFTAYLYNPLAIEAEPPAFTFFGVKRCPIVEVAA